MEAFATNDLKADGPGVERRDEVGDMARTVEVFKKNGLEVERMRAEQQIAEKLESIGLSNKKLRRKWHGKLARCIVETSLGIRGIPWYPSKWKTFTKEEKYTAYKEICVPEERTRTCTVYHKVAEERTEWVTKCVEVPTVEDRVVYHNVTKCVQVTEMLQEVRR